MKISCDFSKTAGKLNHFWESTGFTPAALLLSPEMEQMIAYAGALPHRGIVHVRIHYLLDLLEIEGFGAQQTYRWDKLDKGLDLLVHNGLKPFFELMGNPSGLFSDFNNDGQLHAWKRMVRDLATHCMDRYGKEEVESWYFETWNEPDGGWWHQWPQEVPFCNYYDACSEGLREANPKLIFGGPGTCKHLSALLKAILAHCDTGTNYFTRKKGVRLDFISVHEKGAPSCREDITPDNRALCEAEIEIVHYIREKHPRLAHVPFMNNECDPIVNWKDIHTWHAHAYYAALVCKVINQHQRTLVENLGCTYPILSNDNGFLGPWGFRTLLARFGDEKQLERGEFEQVKKPVLTVMELLALLGDTLVTHNGTADIWSDIGIIATRHANGMAAILIYNHNDGIMCSGSERIDLSLVGVPYKNPHLIHYRIDQQHTNPFGIWDRARGPRNADADLLAQMRNAAEPVCIDEPRDVPVSDEAISLQFDLPLPGISLILLSDDPQIPPPAVAGLKAARYKGLTDCDNVQLSWKGSDSRFLRTYEVFFSETADGSFVRINKSDLLSSIFYHARKTSGGTGFYKIRSVDYWGRTGEESEIFQF